VSNKGQSINIDEWKLVKCNVEDITPQQINNDDCGVFIIMFADYILDNIPLLHLVQNDILYFRKNICLNITEGS